MLLFFACLLEYLYIYWHVDYLPCIFMSIEYAVYRISYTNLIGRAASWPSPMASPSITAIGSSRKGLDWDALLILFALTRLRPESVAMVTAPGVGGQYFTCGTGTGCSALPLSSHQQSHSGSEHAPDGTRLSENMRAGCNTAPVKNGLVMV